MQQELPTTLGLQAGRGALQEDDEGLNLMVALLGLVVVAKNIIAGIQERRRLLDLRLTGG